MTIHDDNIGGLGLQKEVIQFSEGECIHTIILLYRVDSTVGTEKIYYDNKRFSCNQN